MDKKTYSIIAFAAVLAVLTIINLICLKLSLNIIKSSKNGLKSITDINENLNIANNLEVSEKIQKLTVYDDIKGKRVDGLSEKWEINLPGFNHTNHTNCGHNVTNNTFGENESIVENLPRTPGVNQNLTIPEINKTFPAINDTNQSYNGTHSVHEQPKIPISNNDDPASKDVVTDIKNNKTHEESFGYTGIPIPVKNNNSDLKDTDNIPFGNTVMPSPIQNISEIDNNNSEPVETNFPSKSERPWDEATDKEFHKLDEQYHSDEETSIDKIKHKIKEHLPKFNKTADGEDVVDKVKHKVKKHMPDADEVTDNVDEVKDNVKKDLSDVKDKINKHQNKVINDKLLMIEDEQLQAKSEVGSLLEKKIDQ